MRADADPVRITYLRFTVAGVNRRPVLQARVRLQVNSTFADSGGTIHRISDTGWDEATLTYVNRPAVDGPALSTLGPVATGNVVELDLGTAITTDGTYAFAIDSASLNGVSYKSAASVVGQKPILVVTVANGPAPSVQIVQPPDGATFFVGDAVTLQGTATDMAGIARLAIGPPGRSRDGRNGERDARPRRPHGRRGGDGSLRAEQRGPGAPERRPAAVGEHSSARRDHGAARRPDVHRRRADRLRGHRQ